jgi:phage terminase small subunit
MGRNKTPTAILEAKGAFLINPQRARPNEPKGDHPLGSPPKYLSKEQKKIWKEIAKRLLPGVALESDRDAFELMVRLTAAMRHGVKMADGTIMPAEVAMKAADRSTLISLWSRFAMTPADRSRVSAEKPQESALDKFMRNRPASQSPRETVQ